ncbi:HU family DNA-binding protein [Accumulibacter sp.]
MATGRAVEVLLEEIVAGGAVTRVGFGACKAAPRAAREGKNPKIG